MCPISRRVPQYPKNRVPVLWDRPFAVKHYLCGTGSVRSPRGAAAPLLPCTVRLLPWPVRSLRGLVQLFFVLVAIFPDLVLNVVISHEHARMPPMIRAIGNPPWTMTRTGRPQNMIPMRPKTVATAPPMRRVILDNLPLRVLLAPSFICFCSALTRCHQYHTEVLQARRNEPPEGFPAPVSGTYQFEITVQILDLFFIDIPRLP